ncbi:CYTH domain-containing protein [Paenibacillus taihuensis]|uniref:CYTH domain-containing protein n=1 Tax=Paenibacillus taihuensis TaxID=1156355 RepID=A0A3D9Q187_9BACL|nr:CYTH domain-containing protein [Paenibacillus taihuensis]REE56431.1 CYTH domain-containing protein [Paenibacillus taihuensis]
MALEVERKFLLPAYPEALVQSGELVIQSEQRIEQTYLAIADGQELRVRRIVDLATEAVHFTHTFKSGGGLSREEIEYEIAQGLYEQVMQAVQAIPLTKNRITARWGDTTVEIDIYDQIQLSVLEVEFESEEEALAFTSPEWFGPDISTAKEYSNKKVWRDLQTRRPS